MPKTLKDFVGWLDKHHWPKLVCPTCGDGALDLKDTWHVYDIASTEP